MGEFPTPPGAAPVEGTNTPAEVTNANEDNSESLSSLAIPVLVSLEALNLSPDVISHNADNPPIDETTGTVVLALGLTIPIIASEIDYLLFLNKKRKIKS